MWRKNFRVLHVRWRHFTTHLFSRYLPQFSRPHWQPTTCLWGSSLSHLNGRNSHIYGTLYQWWYQSKFPRQITPGWRDADKFAALALSHAMNAALVATNLNPAADGETEDALNYLQQRFAICCSYFRSQNLLIFWNIVLRPFPQPIRRIVTCYLLGIRTDSIFLEDGKDTRTALISCDVLGCSPVYTRSIFLWRMHRISRQLCFRVSTVSDICKIAQNKSFASFSQEQYIRHCMLSMAIMGTLTDSWTWRLMLNGGHMLKHSKLQMPEKGTSYSKTTEFGGQNFWDYLTLTSHAVSSSTRYTTYSDLLFLGLQNGRPKIPDPPHLSRSQIWRLCGNLSHKPVVSILDKSMVNFGFCCLFQLTNSSQL